MVSTFDKRVWQSAGWQRCAQRVQGCQYKRVAVQNHAKLHSSRSITSQVRLEYNAVRRQCCARSFESYLDLVLDKTGSTLQGRRMSRMGRSAPVSYNLDLALHLFAMLKSHVVLGLILARFVS